MESVEAIDELNQYDAGWEAAWEDGHEFAENWWLDQAASGIQGPYSSLRPHLATNYYGKNEPEDQYYS